MTWDEFKSKIDQALSENGKDGSIEIWFIDVTFPEEIFASFSGPVVLGEDRAERIPMLEVRT